MSGEEEKCPECGEVHKETPVTYWYSLKVVSPLGHIICKYKKDTKYSAVIDKATGSLILREHRLKGGKPKPLYIVYSPYVLEYGDDAN